MHCFYAILKIITGTTVHPNIHNCMKSNSIIALFIRQILNVYTKNSYTSIVSLPPLLPQPQMGPLNQLLILGEYEEHRMVMVRGKLKYLPVLFCGQNKSHMDYSRIDTGPL